MLRRHHQCLLSVIPEFEFTTQRGVPAQRGGCGTDTDGDVAFDVGMLMLVLLREFKS